MNCPKCRADNPPSNRFCADCGASLTPFPEAPSPARTQTLAPPSDPFSTGILFADRYQIIEELGRGGMGRVYKAFDTKIQERIAIKIIRPDIAGDERTITRFRNELKLARQITHRNVCRTHDLGQDGRTHFITMEFVAGESLQNIMRMTRPLSIGTAVDYARQVCDGLAEAHRLGVVHRDLKPQNIIIDEAGTAKIMDFGIARTVDAAGQTGEGIMIGTPEYMSPEQAEGKPADPRADLYAVGIMLYEMVTGKRPFAGDTPLSVALKQKTEIPRPPAESNAQVPAVLNALILKCLEKDKATRYQTAAEIAAELTRIEGALPRSGEYTRAAWTGAFPSQRKRRMAIAAGAAAVLILAAVLGYLFVFKAPRAIALAVLPFKDLTPDRGQGLLCEGLTDEIRNRLAENESLQVTFKDSSDLYRESAKTLVEIGRDLNVRKIVSGSLKIENGACIVQVQLGSAGTGSISRSNTFKDKPENIKRMQVDVASWIAEALSLRPSRQTSEAAKGRDTSSLIAWTEYREGLRSIDKYRSNRASTSDFFEAVEHFKNAIAKDPAFIDPYYGLGNAYEARFVDTHDAADQAAMENQFRQAFEINPSLAESNLGLGWIYFHRENHEEAYRYFKRAVELEPDNPGVKYGAGSFLRSLGLFKNALRHYRRAIALDPKSYRWYLTAITCCTHMGDLSTALDLTDQAEALAPQIVTPYTYRARILLLDRRADEAEAALNRAAEINPKDQMQYRLRICLAALRGKTQAALDMMAMLSRPDDLYRYEITNTLCILGRNDQAVQNIRTGIEKGFELSGEYIYTFQYLIHNPFLRSLKGIPRFEEILAAERLKYEENLSKFGEL